MTLAKPPIVGDVAELVGNYADKVENRSLLLNKFSIHKRWPVDPYAPNSKWDDASRWSFIRVAENGLSYLERELKNEERRAHGPNANEHNRARHADNAELIRKLKGCACRRSDRALAELRKKHVEEFAKRFAAHPERHLVLIGKLCGPLAVNLSDSLIQNAGNCLDRLFGEPYIPGSAVKGVSRHVALARLRSGAMTVTVFQQLFGTADVDFSEKGDLAAFASEIPAEMRNRRGGFDFLAAYPISDVQVAVDMTNVHYPDYYQSGNEKDLALEEPRPNPFPVTSPGANFAFCIVRNGMAGDDSLVGLMSEIVREALEKQGIGAKTAAGYGWFDCSGTEEQLEIWRRQREVEVRKAAMSELATRIAALAGQSAEAPEFRAEIEAIESHASFADLPSKDREELVRQRKRLPQASLSDVMRAQWTKAGVNSVIGLPVFGKKLNIAAADRATAEIDDEMSVVIGLLREPEGIGQQVWTLLKSIADDGKRKSKYKHIPNVVGTIRDLSKNKLQLGKMP